MLVMTRKAKIRNPLDQESKVRSRSMLRACLRSFRTKKKVETVFWQERKVIRIQKPMLVMTRKAKIRNPLDQESKVRSRSMLRACSRSFQTRIKVETVFWLERKVI